MALSVPGVPGPATLALFVSAQLGLIGVSYLAHQPEVEVVTVEATCPASLSPSVGWSYTALFRALAVGLVAGAVLVAWACARGGHLLSGALGFLAGTGLAQVGRVPADRDILPYTRDGAAAARARLIADEDW